MKLIKKETNQKLTLKHLSEGEIFSCVFDDLEYLAVKVSEKCIAILGYSDEEDTGYAEIKIVTDLDMSVCPVNIIEIKYESAPLRGQLLL